MSAPAGPAAPDAAPCNTKAHPRGDGLSATENNPKACRPVGSRPRRQRTSMDNLETLSVGGCSKPTDAAPTYARA